MTYVYALSNGYKKKYFDTLNDISVVFLKLTQEKLKRYTLIYGDDYGYLDLGIWIDICDKDTRDVLEIMMPSNISTMLQNTDDIFENSNAIDFVDRIMGTRIKIKPLKANLYKNI